MKSTLTHAGLTLLTALTLSFAACGDDPAPADTDASDDTATDLDTHDTHDTRSDDGDATADTDEDILYPGYLCNRNDHCSTGLCYGFANSQGAFEPAKCQTVCLELYDYNRYCDSDDDCCKGRCCLGCGAKEGLCVLEK
ncbi:MAG: hypothetical protein JNJ59_26275 [Deltaproteobacteria bacterium]|nr:hypothetical protein [Deltaproteobacteria bacterium]